MATNNNNNRNVSLWDYLTNPYLQMQTQQQQSNQMSPLEAYIYQNGMQGNGNAVLGAGIGSWLANYLKRGKEKNNNQLTPEEQEIAHGQSWNKENMPQQGLPPLDDEERAFIMKYYLNGNPFGRMG